MTWWGWTILIVANLPVLYAVRWTLFSTWEDFWDAIVYWLTPDVISMFRGEWTEDTWNELKLLVWLVGCAAIVYGEYVLLWAYVLP